MEGTGPIFSDIQKVGNRLSGNTEKLIVMIILSLQVGQTHSRVNDLQLNIA